MPDQLDTIVEQLPLNLRLFVTPLLRGLGEGERSSIAVLTQQAIAAKAAGDIETLSRLYREWEPKIPTILRPMLETYLSGLRT